ncbi:Ig-like domain-containing protein [Kluyvera georgiana]|uniref:Ig-like domain-containing protein n=1 Tax=Kluyvera georgiana TaxID=73098 RepID=UPI003F664EC8
MAEPNALSPTVDIISRETGREITSYSQSADRVVNLSQSSVVKINASPESVNFYERQGDDLIVHMKDGTTVRYQSFFTLDANGLHSELIFEDEYGVHRAAFPFATEAGPMAAEAVVPTIAETSIGALTGSAGIAGISTLGVLGAIAVAAVIGGIAIAASSSGDGGGNDGHNSGGGGGKDPEPVATPKIFISPFANDNALNSAEVQLNQLLWGSTQNIASGQMVTITLNGKTYFATVGGDGLWRVEIPAADLQTLANGSQVVTVSYTEKSGKVITASETITIDTSQPAVAIAILSTDGHLSAAEAQQPMEVRGITSLYGTGVTLIVTLNGKNYVATVDSAGNWSVSIPSADLQLLQDGNYTISARVSLGTLSAQATQNLDVMTHDLPKPTLNTPFGDGYVNSAEHAAAQTLTGTTGVKGSWQTVTVTIGNKTWETTADANGKWTLNLSAADMAALAAGTLPITVVAKDAAGNTGQVQGNVTVDLTPPSLAVLPLTSDNILNLQEAKAGQTPSGIASIEDQGRTVSVTLNGKNYTALVGVDGKWAIPLSPADLTALPQGTNNIVATLTDAVGNTTTINGSFNVKTLLPTVTVTPLTGDNALNAAEVKTDQTLSGITKNAPAGSTVQVTVGDHRYLTQVDANGNWSVQISAADLQKLPQGPTSISVTVTDLAGQTGTGSSTVNVDTLKGGVAISIIAGDDYISKNEATGQVTIRGTSAGLDANTTVTVTIGTKTFPAQTDAQGNWSVTLPAGTLLTQPDGALTVTATAIGPNGAVSDNHTINIVINNLPNVSFNTPFGDGVLNAQEITQNQTLSGKTGVSGAGQKVVITLDGVNYQGTVDANGNWSATIPSGALSGLTNASSPLQVTVTVTDIAGNTGSQNLNVPVDVVPPQVTISAFAGNNYLNANEANITQTLSGTATDVQTGDKVTLVLNGKTYTTTIGQNGAWSIPVTSADLKALPDGTINMTVTVTDSAGNATVVTKPIQVAIDPTKQPVLSVDPVTSNNIIDAAEINQAITITGKTLNVQQGQTVTVSLGSQSWTGTVDASGIWSVQIPQGDLAALTSNGYTLVVTTSDQAGNTVSSQHNFTIDKDLTAISVLPVTGDDAINVAEAGAGFSITGISSNLTANTIVTVTLNGKTYSKATEIDGTWSVLIPAADAKALSDGKSTVTVSAVDAAGNPISVSHDFTVIINKVPSATINTPFGDGILNSAEAAGSPTLTGSTGVLGAGQTVVVNIGGINYSATVDANGNWSLDAPAALLNAPDTGLTPIPYTVTAKDVAGNTSVISGTIDVDKTPPALTLQAVSGGYVNAVEVVQSVPISGTGGPYDPDHPHTIVVAVNNQTYTTTLLSDGTWSISLPAGALVGLPDGPINYTATISDSAGNPTVLKGSFILDANPATLPTITINAISGDDFINVNESSQPLVISGKTTNTEAGSIISVLFNGITYTGALVQPDGTWSLTLPSSVMTGLTSGTQVITATVTDVAGNSATSNHNLTFVADASKLPSLTVNVIAGDDVINAIEHLQALTISGSSQNLTTGRIVTVTLNGKTYTGLVDSTGKWSVDVPAADVQALSSGSGSQPYTVTANATDIANNAATPVNHTVTVDLIGPTLTLNPGSFVADGKVNISETAAIQVLSGTAPEGQIVTLNVGGKIVDTVAGPGNSWSMTVPLDVLQNLTQGKGEWTLSATDADGNTTQVKIPVDVNSTTPPTLTMSTPFGDALVNINDAQAGTTITGTSRGLAANTVVTLYVDGVAVRSGTVGSDGKWSIIVGSNDIPANSDGTHVYTVSASDGWGNQAGATANVDYLLTRPALPSLSGLFGGDGIINLAEATLGQTLSGSTSVTGPGQTVKITIDGINPITVPVNNDGSWSLTLPPAALLALSDGSHLMTVTIVDRAGNAATGSASFNVQTDTLPTPTLAAPFGDGILNVLESGATIGTIGGSTGLAKASIQSVTIRINGVDYGPATINADGSWSLSLTSAQMKAFPDGKVSVDITVTDNAANVSTGSGSFIAATHSAPSLSPVVAFTDGVLNFVESTSNQTISGTTNLSGAGQKVSLVLNGVTYSGTVLADGRWTINLPKEVLQNLPNGSSQMLEITATDAAGNTDTQSVNFTVHTSLPTPSIVDLFGSDNLLSLSEASGPLTLTGTTGVTSGTQYVKLTIDVNGVSYPATVLANGNWILALPANALQFLSNGKHTITVTAEDQFGNVNESVREFSAALSNPVITLSSAFGDGNVSLSDVTSPMTLTGNLTTAIPGNSTVSVTIGGKTFPGVVNSGGTGWSLTMNQADWSGVTNGLQSIDVKVTDVAGNVTTITQPVNIALIQPTISVTSAFAGGTLDYGESRLVQTLTGTSTNLEAGQKITITIGGKTFQTTVQSDHSWSLQVTPEQMVGMTSGTITLTANDKAGNPTIVTGTTDLGLIIDITPPAAWITIDTVGLNNSLNAAALASGSTTISGKSSNVSGVITLEIGGHTYENIPIGSDGSWQVIVPKTDLSEGPNSIIASGAGAPNAVVNVTVDTVAPSLAINAFADLNSTGKGLDQTLTGISDANGREVRIELLNSAGTVVKVYYSTVAGGSWSASIPKGDLAGLSDGDYTFRASVSDSAGNSYQTTEGFTLDATPPLLDVNFNLLPAVLNTLAIKDGLVISGDGKEGENLIIRIGPLSLPATVGSDSKWSVTFPKADLLTLTDGAQVVSVTATDAAGNTSTNSVTLNVALNKDLGVAIDSVFGNDGVLNIAESQVTQILTGHVDGDYRGATVKLTIAGTNINIPLDSVAVGNDGKFSINLPPSLWQGLLNQTLGLQLVVTDANGNVVPSNSSDQLANVRLSLGDLPKAAEAVTLAVGNVIDVDNVINNVESATAHTIGGIVSNANKVGSVVLVIAGQTITGTVDAVTGLWSATLGSSLLQGLQDGAITGKVNITDLDGNLVSTNISFGVAKTLPTITLGSLFGDGTLSLNELVSGVISGTTTGLAAGRQVTITIGSTASFTATVDSTGKWSVSLPSTVADALKALGTTGPLTVTMAATDQYGNNATSVSGSLKLDLLAPVLNSLTLFGTNTLSAVGAQTDKLITGTVANAADGSLIQVTVGGKVFTGTVSGGSFNITAKSTDLLGLTDGNLTASVKITTPSGNTVTDATHNAIVNLTKLPVVNITSLFGNDGYLNLDEANLGQTIGGTVTNLDNGFIKVTIGGVIHDSVAVTGGVWSLELTKAELKGLGDGSLTLTASVTDSAGNQATSSQVITSIVTNVPKITLNPLFGGNGLDLNDLLSQQFISGSVTNLAAGSQVKIALGGFNYTATVNADGTWKAALPTVDLQKLADGPLNVSVSVQDMAGNKDTVSVTPSVAINTLPTLVVNSIFGDGGLSIADLLKAQVISGTTNDSGVGSKVTVTLGSHTYNATVGADKTWSVSVPTSDLSQLADGNLTVGVTLTNPAGNVASGSGALTVISHNPPSISLTSLFGNDGWLNISEANTAQTITGKINGLADGAKVVVTVGNTVLDPGKITVDATTGTWSATVDSSILKGITDGTLKVTAGVTDKVGNTSTTSVDVSSKQTAPTVSINPLSSLLGLVVLTISGKSTNVGAGGSIRVSLVNSTAFAVVTPDASGNWTASLGLVLNLGVILSLTSVLNIDAVDAAGNHTYLNVGLNGSIISTTPPATLMATEAETLSVLAASESSDDHSTLATTTTTAAKVSVLSTESTTEAQSAENQQATEENAATGAYTIGGVTIDLADGTHQTGDSVTGSAGNDTIHLSSLGLTHIDGGAGTDTLILDGLHLQLDLTALGDKIQNIEIVDLGSSGTNSITLDLQQALRITDKPEDDLLIKGVSGDQVNLVQGQGDIWSVSGQRDIGGIQFDVYHNSSQSNTLGDVLIQHGLHVNMV